ncbi:hypothetical protein CAEBREN_28442 [Caenorhabditis brenneri]|uniref:RNA-directed DNA polymerase n=1 Tax=Caenorhabditis brenneri TaxID=135651 RepID=G0MS41_CAEBE|nr:hypothetical protein CAEBREN_28442 [Caenorhabditis brenneri]
MAAQQEMNQRFMEQYVQGGAGEPRATAGGSGRVSSNARLMSDLARRVSKFQYDLGDPDGYRRWINRNKLTFTEDGAPLSEREKVRLLLGALEDSTYQRFLDAQTGDEDIYEKEFEEVLGLLEKTFGDHRSLMVRRQACLAINRNSGEFTDPLAYSNFVSQSVIDAKLSSMSSDEWSIFLFLRGLTGPEDAEAKLFLMQFVESSERKKEKLTLSTVYDEWIRFSQLKTQSKVVAPNKPAPRLDVNWVQKKSAHGKKQEKKPGEKDAQPRSPKKITCFSCGEVGHKSPDCPTKPTQGSRPKANASKSNTPKSTQIISVDDECHPLPTSEDIFGRLQGKVFSQIDLRDAYLQVELDDESQKLAVINTHLGLFRYKRMAFGLKTAPAIFQKIMDKMISGIPGVAAYLDDLIVATDTVEEHREILFKLFDRIQEYGFRVSLEKCAFAQSEITFLGFIIDGNGRRPDHKKTAVIRNMQAPVNQKQLGSFLGAITFYSRFVKNISELRGPLDHLMRKDSTWKWTETEQAAFEVLKDAVAKNTMLSHFHADWPIIIAADASQYGIGGVLSHITPEGVETPIAHFARTLTDTEQRYSQIEKEGLALIYTVTKCHKFVYGRKFRLQTDHRPLLAIFGSHRDLPVHSQNRLVRWATTLLAYDFDLSYVRTTQFAKADWLSRMIQDYPRDTDDEVVIAAITDGDDMEDTTRMSLGPISAERIRIDSEIDPELVEIMSIVEFNKWKPKPSSFFEKEWRNVKDRLKIVRGKQVLVELHMGHPGIVAMKQKARAFMFWKGIDKDIEKVVKTCPNCQENAKMPIVTPLHPWPLPVKPWSRIHVDFCGPVDGSYFLVIVDALTKYAEVKMTKNISALTTVELLEEVFTCHGYPELIVSDNGTQFVSGLFQNMCRNYGIEHKTTATYYPRSNGAAERFVDTLKRGLSKFKGTGSVTKQILNQFLFHYRNTPHAALDGKTPANVHFSRTVRTKLSLLVPNPKPASGASLSEYQSRMKENYDKRNRARVTKFQVDEPVFVRVTRGNKQIWGYGVIRKRVGKVLYLVQVDDRVHRCHTNQLRKRHMPEKVNEFVEKIYPIFFGSSGELNGDTRDGVGSPRRHYDDFSFGSGGVGDNLGFLIADPPTFDSNGGGRGSPLSDSSGLVELNSPRSMNNSPYRDRNTTMLDPSSLSSPALPTPVTILGRDSLSNGSSARNGHPPEATSNPSLTLRRSTRTRNPPNRFDPCNPPPTHLSSTGSAQPYQSLPNRGVPHRQHTSTLAHQRGTSSMKGEGVVDGVRDRPAWR